MALADKLRKDKKFRDMVIDDVSNKTVKDFYHAGSITLNLLLSGKVNGGIPDGKITMLAAPKAHGKTVIAMISAGNAQKKGETVIWIDSEFAFDSVSAEMFGMSLDSDKLILIQDNSIENVQSMIMNVFKDYNEKEDGKVFMVVDSIGTLVTSKTVEDSLANKDTMDMTEAKKKNKLSKLILGVSGKNNVTVVLINHLYVEIGAMYSTGAISGGCLTKGHKVQLSDGSLKDISEIKIGQEVKTLIGDKEVQDTFVFDKECFELDLGTEKIQCSEEHKFLVKVLNSGFIWKEAKYIKENDELLYFNDSGNLERTSKTVKSIKTIGTKEVHDISVKEAEHYILESGLVSHNSGAQYVASSILKITSKAKDKDSSGKEIQGNVFTSYTEKGRLAKENSKLKFKLSYEEGMNPYYGLLDDALEGGYVDKPSMGWYSRPSIDEKKYREKDIYTKEFWNPIFKNTDFTQYLEKKYSYVDELNDTSDTYQNELNLKEGEISD